MTRRPKPVIHGRDHQPDGPDPIGELGGGIQFETHPQDGGWLYVKTTGSDPTSPAAGIALLADEGGIYIDAASGQLSLFADNGRVQLSSADDDVEITAAQDANLTATEDVNLVAFIDANVVGHRDVTFDAFRDATLRVNHAAAGGNLILIGLPTTSPGVTGAVWNDTGTLKIS